jgi:hypothetical protein
MGHLKKSQCLLQSYNAAIKQCTDLPTTEDFMDSAAVLLDFDKSMYLVEGSE